MSHSNRTPGPSANGESAMLLEILASLKSIQQNNAQLAAAVDAINGRVNILAGVKQMQDGAVVDASADQQRVVQQPIPTPNVTQDKSTTPPELPVSPLADSEPRRK
jgi:hypothetical protein